MLLYEALVFLAWINLSDRFLKTYAKVLAMRPALDEEVTIQTMSKLL